MNRCRFACHRLFFSSCLLGLLLGAAALLCPRHANAQFAMSPQNKLVLDSAALQPPKGARVAIVEFSDLECPSCAHANPTLKEAAAKYHVPWIRHDFPLRQHVWSFQAAVNARWFDTKSTAIGNEYRDQVFANQMSLASLDDLRQFTAKFAADRHISLPFVMDPQNKLAAEVRADYALGERMGVDETPTIWVVTDLSKGTGLPYVRVYDVSRLFSYLDQAEDATSSEAAKSSNRASRK